MRIFATGGREGKTFTWNACEVKFEFVDGVCEIPDNQPELLRYFQVNLQVRTELEAPPKTTIVEENENDPLRLAILALDTEDDKNWNSNDEPAIAALGEQFGNVTRKQINAVASDLNRETVRERKQQQ